MIRRLAGGVGANIFDKVAISVMQLAMVPVLARSWGLHVYGLWVLLITIPSFLAVGDFGFATAAGTKMTMMVARGERKEAVHVFQSAWVAILCSSGLLGVLAISAAYLVPAKMFGADPGLPLADARLTLVLLMAYGIAAIQGSIFQAGFRCSGFFAMGACWHGATALFEGLLTAGAVALGAQPPLAALTLLCGRLLCLGCQQILLQRCVPWLTPGFRLATRQEVRALFAPAGAVMMLPVAQACSLQGSAIALGIAAGQSAVPAFTTARTLARIGLQMCLLFNTALMPEFSAASARGDQRVKAAMVLAMISISAALVIPYSVGFAVFGRWIIAIWTHGVVNAPAPLVVTMAASVLFAGLWYPFSILILAINRHASYSIIFVGLAVASMPAAFFLSKRFGAAGASAALMLLDVSMFVVILVLVRSLLVSGQDLKMAIPLLARRARKLAGWLKTRRAM